MNDLRDLINAIEDHLAEDKRQLAAIETQADAVGEALADLMTRLSLEIDAAAGSWNGTRHLRG
jgi:hypothetical protein